MQPLLGVLCRSQSCLCPHGCPVLCGHHCNPATLIGWLRHCPSPPCRSRWQQPLLAAGLGSATWPRSASLPPPAAVGAGRGASCRAAAEAVAADSAALQPGGVTVPPSRCHRWGGGGSPRLPGSQVGALGVMEPALTSSPVCQQRGSLSHLHSNPIPISAPTPSLLLSYSILCSIPVLFPSPFLRCPSSLFHPHPCFVSIPMPAPFLLHPHPFSTLLCSVPIPLASLSFPAPSPSLLHPCSFPCRIPTAAHPYSFPLPISSPSLLHPIPFLPPTLESHTITEYPGPNGSHEGL